MRTPALFVLIFAMSCSSFFDDRRDGLEGTEVTYEDPGSVTTCVYPPPVPVLTGNGHAVDLRDCAKLEGGDLGESQTLYVDGQQVTIDGWQNKDGEGEYIGFEVDGNVTVVVKAGTELFEAGPGTWVHPGGTSGPTAKGISFVAFCVPPDSGGGEGEDPGEPECTTITGGDPGGGQPGPSGGGDGESSDPGDGSGGGACESTVCSSSNGCGEYAGCINGCCSMVIM